MKAKIVTGLCLGAVMFLSVGLHAAEVTAPEDSGLPVGRHAPTFTLKNQHDEEVSLETLLKKGPVAVIFFRSAEWCLYCKAQLVQLQRNLKEIERAGQVVAISYDSPETLQRFAHQKKITYPLLSDIGSKTIDAYGMTTKDATAEYTGISRHGTFVLDQKGTIRSRFLVFSYEDRSAVNALVQALKAAQNFDGGTKP